MAGVSKHQQKSYIKLLPAGQLVTNALDNMTTAQPAMLWRAVKWLERGVLICLWK
jgi:hypothetical protein